MQDLSFPPLLWPDRLSRALDRAWASGCLARPLLEPQAIIAAAAARERAAPSDGPWRPRLDILCAALRDEAQLNSLGLTLAYGQLVRIVAARARAERLWREHPTILRRPLASPVVLVGQMRSGTTRVHRLLARDPRFAHTRLFETLEPVPHRGWRGAIDTRPAAAWTADALLRRCNPVIGKIHPTAPFAAEEEYGLHGFSMWGAQFEGQWLIPSFARACESLDSNDVYFEFARLLQTIGWARRDQPGRTWLIKAPQFCQDFDALLARFPDARIIRLSRAPERVVASGASLAWHQARIQSDTVDRSAIGAEWLRKTVLREARLEASLARHPDVPLLAIDYDQVSDDWRGAMRRIYAFLDRPLTPAIERRMARTVARSTAHQGHRYALEHFALDHAAVAAALA